MNTNITTITNPFTGRKVRLDGPTYKKVISTILQDPATLYATCDSHDPHVFATNFAHIEQNHKIPPYDPTRTGIVFHTNGTWEHMTHRHKMSGTLSTTSTTFPKSTLYTNSIVTSKNECFMATLETIDDWSDLERWRVITTEDGYAFDVFFLIKTIINQLNEIKNGNAFPVYPTNPFTNMPFQMQFLAAFKSRLNANNIEVAEILTVFLRDPVQPNVRSVTDWVEQFENAGLYYYRESDDAGYWSSQASQTNPNFVGHTLNTEFSIWVFTSSRVNKPKEYYWKDDAGLPVDTVANTNNSTNEQQQQQQYQNDLMAALNNNHQGLNDLFGTYSGWNAYASEEYDDEEETDIMS